MRGKILFLAKFAIKIMLFASKGIIKIIPRKKSKWAFGSQNGFGDNPKFLFITIIENHPDIRAIWIAKDINLVKLLKSKGFEAYYWMSLKGLYHTATSKVFISDDSTLDINQYLSEGAFYVNLWHGCGIKRVRWQSLGSYVKKYGYENEKEMLNSLYFKVTFYPILFRQNNLCLTPSHIQKHEFFAPMMNMPEEDCIVGIYPRSRFLIHGVDAAIGFIKQYEDLSTSTFVNSLKEYKKVYIYMPTWRNDGRDFITQAQIDWKQLNDIMRDKEELFILKLHPATKMDVNEVAYYSNILLYPSGVDPYVLLPFIDCLITDYSSVYTDFLIMNKEIILFVFDYDEYMAKSCDLLDYDRYYIGKRVYNFKELLGVIDSNEKCYLPQDKYYDLMNFFWDNNQAKTDIYEEIWKRLN